MSKTVKEPRYSYIKMDNKGNVVKELKSITEIQISVLNDICNDYINTMDKEDITTEKLVKHVEEQMSIDNELLVKSFVRYARLRVDRKPSRLREGGICNE